MKTARLIARYLQWKARSLRRRYCFEAVLALGIGVATLFFQFGFYFLFLWYWTQFSASPVPEVLLTIAGLVIAMQFLLYAGYDNTYREPRSDLHASPAARLIYGGFLLFGPQMCSEALAALRKAHRVLAIDVENCASVLYVAMKEPEAITIAQAWEAVSVRQSVSAILAQLRLFPGVIVQRSELKLAPDLRIEIADFCRQEKERIRESVAVDEVDEW